VQRRLHGIVCGHIHRAGIRTIDGVLYCNDGDWVESCTALVEDMNGRLAVWSWEHAAHGATRERLVDVAA
jgi:UDP-2,3-diacylglucosamine pyrophosphatase LpxH